MEPNKDYVSKNRSVGGIDGFIRPNPSQPNPHSAPLGPIPTYQPPLGRTNQPVQPEPPIAPTSQPDFQRYYSPYQSGRSQPVKKTKRPWSLKRKLLTAGASILVIGFVIGTWYGASLIANLNKVFHGNIFSDARALFSTTRLKGENQGRVNILLAGDSADDPGHQGANLTDSIMVVSIDTRNHTGFMLSVPRDLWVDIPNWSHQKINAANTVNNFHQSGYPPGGMGQLEEIIQTDLGIPIDYYGLIDYSAFRDAVNAVGGITVNINSPDPRGLFDPNISKADGGPLKLPNGPDSLNGQTALNLARARGDPCSCGQIAYGFPDNDFDRTEHQRQMLSALVQKAQTIGVLANPIKVNSLFNSIGNNIHTDLNLQDVLRLMSITKGMSLTKMKSITYSSSGNSPLLTGYESPDGESALIPSNGVDEFGGLQQFYQQLVSNNPVVQEAPSVVILNGSTIDGRAKQEGSVLKNDGFNVLGTLNAKTLYQNSMIIDLTKGKKPSSRALLQNLFARDTTTTTSTASSAEATEAAGYNADFVVVLGQNSQSTQTP